MEFISDRRWILYLPAAREQGSNRFREIRVTLTPIEHPLSLFLEREVHRDHVSLNIQVIARTNARVYWQLHVKIMSGNYRVESKGEIEERYSAEEERRENESDSVTNTLFVNAEIIAQRFSRILNFTRRFAILRSYSDQVFHLWIHIETRERAPSLADGILIACTCSNYIFLNKKWYNWRNNHHTNTW